MRRLAGEDAAAFFFGGVVGNAADGGLGEFLDALFGFGCAVPMAEKEAAFLDFDQEFIPCVDTTGVGLTVVATAVEEVDLYFVHELKNMVGDAFDGKGSFL